MYQRKWVINIWYILILTDIIVLVPASNAIGYETPLDRNKLREKYGQDGTRFNDGRSCNRVCDGRTTTCYYEFTAEKYDTMSGLCGDCYNGTIRDCFLDGCVTANGVPRTIMTINHKLPGPSITCCKNDRIIVDVTNAMHGEEFSIHWHGLHQREAPWFDGVPMVTQCPISAGDTFRYVFNAREAGTHYYHAHSGLHRTNGAIGRLNVIDPNDPNADYYDYDLSEHAIMLSDWINVLAEENAPGIKNQYNLPHSILINGRGSYLNPLTNQFTFAPMAVFYVEEGKRHRFRIDNGASLNCPFEFSINGFNLTVIATDGYPIHPVVVNAFMTSAGERFDVVLNAQSDKIISETLITVRALGSCEKQKLQEFARIVFVRNINDFIPTYEDYMPLKYRPAYESLNIPKITLNNPLTDCTDPKKSYCIAGLEQKGVVGAVGKDLRNEPATVIPLSFGFSYEVERPINYLTAGDLALVAWVNYISNAHYPVPGLTQYDDDVPYCSANNLPANCNHNSLCHCPHLIHLKLCEVYEFFLTDAGRPFGKVNHPVHMHGYGFQIIDMGLLSQYESGNTAFANATHLPVIKDTVAIPSGGFVRIRFRACNPGYWFMHCHFEYHMHSGMTLTLKVGNDSDMVPPPPNFPTCGNFLTPVYDGQNEWDTSNNGIDNYIENNK